MLQNESAFFDRQFRRDGFEKFQLYRNKYRPGLTMIIILPLDK